MIPAELRGFTHYFNFATLGSVAYYRRRGWKQMTVLFKVLRAADGEVRAKVEKEPYKV